MHLTEGNKGNEEPLGFRHQRQKQRLLGYLARADTSRFVSFVTFCENASWNTVACTAHLRSEISDLRWLSLIFASPSSIIGPPHFRGLPRLPASHAVAPRAQVIGRAPGGAESRHCLLLGAVSRGHRAGGGIGRAADQLLDDAIGREGTRRENMRERRVRAGLLDHELGATPIEDDRDAPALRVMQRTQRLRKLGAGGVLVARGQHPQVGPGVEDVRAVDEEVFFKSHGGRTECVSKLAMNWQWLWLRADLAADSALSSCFMRPHFLPHLPSKSERHEERPHQTIIHLSQT
jgi:hypothetical protein